MFWGSAGCFGVWFYRNTGLLLFSETTFGEDHFSGKQKARTLFGPSTK